MRVKFETKFDNLPKLKATLAQIDGKKVSVGVRGENAWLAGIHEYGCRIVITPKMRAWLHANGLHVRESTKEIVIPERSFLRNGFDSNKDKIIKDTQKLVSLAVDGRISGDDVLRQCGRWLQEAIKDYAIDLKKPANHSFTVERKGSSNPLISTGDMIDHIKYEIE